MFVISALPYTFLRFDMAQLTARISKMESKQSQEAEGDCKDFKNEKQAVAGGGK